MRVIVQKVISCYFQLLLPILLLGQNVGIGTNNPVTTLDVHGGFHVKALYKSTGGGMMPYLLEGIKEQQQTIHTQQEEIKLSTSDLNK